ncbi:LOG family protein [Undibacterium squillarum]|uniref:Cytokinin riboside 5'-monophosphate phosphoribohydrolase n=1 Tax=Undibacterium squillarum TaxID=1131567 RepID=A0ABQ2XUJ0_9BURK|nr:TIGR00730 family Rossman fold protein [Undibacterium squillarum]GGX32476.1 cytokinin riboside 5'-monophosphate phosphoribohydrolase [Undibacterium squillarum]
MKSVCVYCGARTGNADIYRAQAAALGAALVNNNTALVYGGGNVGLMGIVADEVMQRGGMVTGVIPDPLLAREVGHDGLTKLHVVKSMHERKALMADLSDGFIAMPGGFGTLDELFEILTWAQLGFHNKPVGLLNTAGYFDHLLQFIDHAANEGFIGEENRRMFCVASDPAQLLQQMQALQSLTNTEDLPDYANANDLR